MASIFKYGHDPIGRIEGDGHVFDQASEPMGRVENGQVYDNDGDYVGKVTPDGRVYDFSGSDPIGMVTDDGRILDNEDNELGESESPHMQEGGAAFLLLLR